jgi:hypothetical protein
MENANTSHVQTQLELTCRLKHWELTTSAPADFVLLQPFPRTAPSEWAKYADDDYYGPGVGSKHSPAARPPKPSRSGAEAPRPGMRQADVISDRPAVSNDAPQIRLSRRTSPHGGRSRSVVSEDARDLGSGCFRSQHLARRGMHFIPEAQKESSERGVFRRHSKTPVGVGNVLSRKQK